MSHATVVLVESVRMTARVCVGKGAMIHCGEDELPIYLPTYSKMPLHAECTSKR